MDTKNNQNPPQPQPQINNQIQLSTIIAAHYSCTRKAIDDWIKRRDQYITIYLTGIGAISMLYFNNTKMAQELLYAIPVISLLVVMAYLSAEIHIAYLCKWLKIEYTSMLEKYVKQYGVISLDPWHWDNSETLKSFYNTGSARLRYTFISLLFVIANIVIPALSIAIGNCSQLQPLIIGTISVIFVLVPLWYIYFTRIKMV